MKDEIREMIEEAEEYAQQEMARPEVAVELFLAEKYAYCGVVCEL